MQDKQKRQINKKHGIIKCLVCKKGYWSHTMKGHITGAGAREVYYAMDKMIDLANNKPYNFSPYVFLRNCPHYHFRKKHTKNKLTFELK